MSNLKEIRTRIASIQSTQKITSAMKLVSASKLRHAQHAVINLRTYADKLYTMMHNISACAGLAGENQLMAKRKPENVVLIVIASNKGLCGSFNSNIVKEIDKVVSEKYMAQHQKGKLKLICIGKNATELLQKKFEILLANESLRENHSFDEVAKMASELMNDFIDKKIDKIEIIYNRFVNPATQQITIESYLPVSPVEEKDSLKTHHINYIFQPSQHELINELIPKVLKLQLFKALLDSIASEHGARMTAMAKATDNAIEILKDLRLRYNNARQSNITNELNEIVGGVEALKG
jgi:F-type H+-transporting ATPase subunit gamma